MVGYAVGEMTSQGHAALAESDVVRPSSVVIARGDSKDHEREKRLKLTTAHTHKQELSNPTSCYEVVTAWVHPR